MLKKSYCEKKEVKRKKGILACEVSVLWVSRINKMPIFILGSRIGRVWTSMVQFYPTATDHNKSLMPVLSNPNSLNDPPTPTRLPAGHSKRAVWAVS